MSKPSPKYTYQVKGRTKDPEKMEFQKFGLCATFTLRDVHTAIVEATKQADENRRKKSFYDAQMVNVSKNHPAVVKIVNDLKGIPLTALKIYVKALVESEKCSDAVKESDKITKRLKQELRIIQGMYKK